MSTGYLDGDLKGESRDGPESRPLGEPGLNGGGGGSGRRGQPVRLLEIIGNAIVGGMESYARNLVANLSRDHFEITCICPYESAYTQSLRDLGCGVYITPLHDDPLWRSIELTVQVVRQHGIDLIHANLANAHALAGIVGCITDTPVVTTIHSRTLWIQELSVARTTGVKLITVCQEAYAQALATGVPLKDLSLIRNGVDIQRFNSGRSGAGFRAAIGVAPDTTLVGFVGRLSWEKGPDKFFQVAQRIAHFMPAIHFAIIGDGPVEPDVRAMIAHSGMAERFHMAGVRSDMEDVYPALDLLIQTSRSEAMPLAILEAMASGVPVAAIAVGGIAELIEGGTTGLMVSPGDWPGISSPYPGDWEGVAGAALDLLRRPERLRQMGVASRERIERHFDLTRSVSETAALFERIARPSRAQTESLRALPTVVAKSDERRLRPKARVNGGPNLASVRSPDPARD